MHPRYRFVQGKPEFPLFDIARIHLLHDSQQQQPADEQDQFQKQRHQEEQWSGMAVNINSSVPVVGSVARVAGFGFRSSDDYDDEDEVDDDDNVVDPSTEPDDAAHTRSSRPSSLHRLVTRTRTRMMSSRGGSGGGVLQSRTRPRVRATLSAERLALFQVDIPVVSGSDCVTSYKSSDKLQLNDTRNICAGYLGVGRCDSW